MRFACVPFAVFAASLTFAAPTAPTVKREIVPSSFPWPWPVPVQYVTVTNWPDVQPVSGTVSVGNLPAVQTVGGTINVGNLPLDSDGAVRVARAPARVTVMYELVPAPIVLDTYELDLPTIIDASSFSAVAVYTNATGNPTTQVLWRWPGDGPDDFLPVVDYRGSVHNIDRYSVPLNDCVGAVGVKFVCTNLGGSVKLQLHFPPFANNSPPFTVNSVRVYLIP